MLSVSNVNLDDVLVAAIERLETMLVRLGSAFPGGGHPLSNITATLLRLSKLYDRAYNQAKTVFAEFATPIGTITLVHCVDLLDELCRSAITSYSEYPALQQSLVELLVAIEHWAPQASRGCDAEEVTTDQHNELTLLIAAYGEVEVLMGHSNDPAMTEQLHEVLLRLARNQQEGHCHQTLFVLNPRVYIGGQ